jgi:hypothetical protein
VGLFAFSDIDGRGDEVRLQHCLGLAYADGKLYIADTYNNKIKVCDPPTKTVKTLVGNREPGKTDDPAHFYQPGGLSVANGVLYVADTDNSLIRTVNLKDRQVRTLEIEGLNPPPKPKSRPRFPNAQVVEVPPQKVAPGDKLLIDVALPVPSGMKLNTEGSMPYLVETPGRTGVLAGGGTPEVHHVEPPTDRFSATIPLAKRLAAGDSVPLKLSVSVLVCNEKSNLCQIKSYVFNVPVAIAEKGPEKLTLKAAAAK